MKLLLLFLAMAPALCGQAIQGAYWSTAPLRYNAVYSGTHSTDGDVFTNVEGRTPATISGAVTGGTSTSLTVSKADGLVPGSSIYFTDASPETVTVAGTYSMGSTTVPLTTAVANNHSNGAAVQWVGGTTYGFLDDAQLDGANSSNSLSVKMTNQNVIVPVLIATQNSGAYLSHENTLVDGTHTWKGAGFYSLNGVLYWVLCLQTPAGSGAGGLQTSIDCSIMKSTDFGANWLNPAGSTNTAPPMDSTAMFTGTNNAAPYFVLFGPDGTCPAGNPDDCQHYVYMASAYQKSNSTSVWNNGDAMILMRAPIGANLQDKTQWQYLTGGSIGAGTATWGSSNTSAIDIINVTGKIGMNGIFYNPQKGRFVLWEFWYKGANASSNHTNTTLRCYEAPHIDGPWTAIAELSGAAYGWYNPQVLHYSLWRNYNLGYTTGYEMVVSGNFLDGSYNGPWFVRVMEQIPPRMPMGFPGSRYSPERRGLQVQYDFNDYLPNNRVLDRSGNGYNVTSASPPMWANGGGISGNGPVTADTTNFTTAWNGTPGDFTVMITYVRVPTPVNGAANYERLAEKAGSANAGFFITRYATNDNTFGVGIGPTQTASSPYGYYPSSTFTDSLPHVIAAKRVSGVETLYKGATNLGSVTGIGTNNLTNAAMKLLGDGVTAYCSCSIFDVRVWNRGLSDDEVGKEVAKITDEMKRFGVAVQ